MTTSLLSNELSHNKGTLASRDIENPDEKIVYSNSKEIYRDICVLKSLNKAKFPVYLVCSKVNKQNYAMKVFAYKNGQQHSYFKNEIRFACLQHPNVIRNLHIEHQKDTISKGVIAKVSYTIMEYAPYGDFFDFVMNHGEHIDEKLTRTYFKQLIEGLDYLHKNGVSHMDIKLENLLLGKDYSLKVADFDLSHFESDKRVISKGTKFYRAPDVMQGKCRSTKSADIYAAGIVLFTSFTKGILPHSESALVSGVNFAELLYANDPLFWTKHAEIQKKDASIFEDDFKELFISMTRPRAEDRATIEKIKMSRWYNGACYTPEEVKEKMQKIVGY